MNYFRQFLIDVLPIAATAQGELSRLNTFDLVKVGCGLGQWLGHAVGVVNTGDVAWAYDVANVMTSLPGRFSLLGHYTGTALPLLSLIVARQYGAHVSEFWADATYAIAQRRLGFLFDRALQLRAARRVQGVEHIRRFLAQGYLILFRFRHVFAFATGFFLKKYNLPGVEIAHVVFFHLFLAAMLSGVWERWLERAAQDHVAMSRLPREAFKTFQAVALVDKGKPIGANPHREAAGDRSAAERVAKVFAAGQRRALYHWYRTARGAKNGATGWTYDEATRECHRPDVFPHDTMVYVGDKDWKLESALLQPYLFYSFQPEDVAADRGEYRFWVENNQVDYAVVGGNKFVHPVREWRHEWVDIPLNHAAYRCMPPGIVRFELSYRRTSVDRALVLANPVEVFFDRNPRANSYPWSFCQFGSPPSLEIERGKENYVSVGGDGTVASARVPLKSFGSLQAIVATSKNLSTEVIMTNVPGMTRPEAHIVRAHLQERVTMPQAVMRIPVEHAVLSYQYGTFVPEAKVPMVAFMTPLLRGGFVAARTRGNDECCILERVTHAGRRANMKVPHRYYAWADEFLDYFCGNVNLVPADFEEVLDNQSRPSQRQLLLRADDGDSSLRVTCFQKAEAYHAPNAPRNINQMPPTHKLLSARYAYPFMTHMKKFPWYAFGRTPIDIAHHVADLAAEADVLVETDFNRWDGSRSMFLFWVCCSAIVRLYTLYGKKEELDRIIRGEANQECVTEFLVMFLSFWMVLSGSMFTSAFNSFCNAFIAYCAYRASGLSHEEAVRMLEKDLFGGDDGIGRADAEKLSEVCGDLNVYIDATLRRRGKDIPTFLSRYFTLEVWEGNPNSHCDILRQLSKLHLSGNSERNVTPAVKALEKAIGFQQNDSNTPLVGQWAVGVCDLLKGTPALDRVSERHLAFFTRVNPSGAGWPNELTPDQQACALYNCGLADSADEIFEWLQAASRIEDYLTCPCLRDDRARPQKTPGAVVVDENDAVRDSQPVPLESGSMVGDRATPSYPTSTEMPPLSNPRLGQVKMTQINEFVVQLVKHVKVKSLLYTGAYGPDSFYPMVEALSGQCTVWAYDPMFKTRRDKTREKMCKGLRVMEKRFTLGEWKKDTAGKKPLVQFPFMFYDDSLIIEGEGDDHVSLSRRRHLEMVIKWVVETAPTFAFLKVPERLCNSELSIEGYEVARVFASPVVLGHTLSETRWFLRRASGKTATFKDLVPVPWPTDYHAAINSLLAKKTVRWGDVAKKQGKMPLNPIPDKDMGE